MSDRTRLPALTAEDEQLLTGRLGEQGGIVLSSFPSSAQAFMTWRLLERYPRVWVCVTDGAHSLEDMADNLRTLAFENEAHLHIFPPWDALPTGDSRPHTEITGARFNTLTRYLEETPGGVILTSIQALMQKTLSPHVFASHLSTWRRMKEYDVNEMAALLLKAGYSFTHEVQDKGEAGLRGGILDVWPPTSDWPVRLEFFGDLLESIRLFDPATQRSIDKVDQITLSPPDEWSLLETAGATGTLLDYLPDDCGWIWVEPDQVKEHAGLFEMSVFTAGAEAFTERFDVIRERIQGCREGLRVEFTSLSPERHMGEGIQFTPGEQLPDLSAQGMHPDIMETARRQYIQALIQAAKETCQVHIFFNTQGALDRFRQMYPRKLPGKSMRLHVGSLSEGFQYPAGKLLVVSESDIYGYRKERRGTGARRKHKPSGVEGPRLTLWTDIQPGELVVHADHGIGKYLGLYEINFQGRLQEVLAVEYADGAKLYVPVSQTHLLSRYIGARGSQPALHRLGGARWKNLKDAAEKAIEDMASTLLETQAARETLEGYAFSGDTAWQHEFEAAFPYQETDDQINAIEAVKADMESIRPMDRLICGDVGYGKTEVAMRAAFKAVMEGKQVAVLVPTTVLAQQHLNTFCGRMAAFPVRIEMLSRFRTKGQQHEVIKELKSGVVDIVIGTHRLVSPDVRFKDLGLVIIDEEQRFGVEHKERLKQLRRLVDVLTLTATPIPRTLYMSLTGARDMSTIQTAPQERIPVETHVIEYSDALVRDVILRELNREGQVFYLHNRVTTIHNVYLKLKQLIPEARIGVGHGQMTEKRLSGVMDKFINRHLDVLLCTTIIESGVDIPNVNTILIDRADRFGMADLYQLRGRVGRYKHKAYAYLLLPRHGALFDTARKRINAIKRYSSLGAGFKLALRDLEIRGAGNLLGAQQSGHIAAVGFDLYCQLLRRTIAAHKGEAPLQVVDVEVKLDFIDLSPRHAESPDAVALPYSYIEDENHRVDAYRYIAGAGSEREIDQLYAGFQDRFGPLPEPVDRLLKVARIRILASHKQVTEVEVRDDKLILTHNNDYIMFERRFPRLEAQTPSARLDEIIEFIRNI